MRVHARVALRRVEVLVAEELLDLAQVRAGVEGSEAKTCRSVCGGATPLWEWIGDEHATVFSY